MNCLELIISRDTGQHNIEVRFASVGIEWHPEGKFFTAEIAPQSAGAHVINKEECLKEFGFYPKAHEAWLCELDKSQEFWWITNFRFNKKGYVIKDD